MTIDPAGPLARRFPLIPRPRPACTALPQRVGELTKLADDAAAGDHARASAVLNQAALLASDLGLPDLARQWCKEHTRIYLHAAALDSPTARLALEPVVNLARLHIRAGFGDAAYALFDVLLGAVARRADIVIDGLTIRASTLVASDEAHRELCTWLWSVHLADGTRALTTAGRWHDAYSHLSRHNGIGQRMLDGRQVAVITCLIDGDTRGARRLIDQTTPGNAREDAVTALLATLTRPPAEPCTGRRAATQIDHYRHLDRVPSLAAFDIRLGLSLLDALEDQNGHRDLLTASVIERTMALGDGYAARDLLAHRPCADMLTTPQRTTLNDIVADCGLGRGSMPAKLQAELNTTLVVAARSIGHALGHPPVDGFTATLSPGRS